MEFHRYEPGLVGGHCISMIHIISHTSKKKNYNPDYFSWKKIE